MNGKLVAGNTQAVTLKDDAEYEALSNDEKMDADKVYLVPDTSADDYQRLLKLSEVMGSIDDIANYADGTIIGVINDIYDRLGGLSFKINESTGCLNVTYSDEVTPATITTPATYVTDVEKINHMESVIGDQEKLASIGFGTVIGALVDIYNRLDGLSFSFDTTNEVVEVSAESET
jgi:hypothetical protein